jgi:hypothetical protein
MSSPIDPTQGTTATKPTNRIHEVTRPTASLAVRRLGGAGRTDGSVSLDAIPANPPQEVLDQMAQAAQRFERITSQGKQLRFVRDGDDPQASTMLEVRGRDGSLEQRLSVADAIDLAGGGSE